MLNMQLHHSENSEIANFTNFTNFTNTFRINISPSIPRTLINVVYKLASRLKPSQFLQYYAYSTHIYELLIHM